MYPRYNLILRKQEKARCLQPAPCGPCCTDDDLYIYICPSVFDPSIRTACSVPHSRRSDVLLVLEDDADLAPMEFWCANDSVSAVRRIR